MKTEDIIWEFLPAGLKGIFNVVNVRKTATEFHVYLDEISQKSSEDRYNKSIIGKGYTDYCMMQAHHLLKPKQPTYRIGRK